MTDYMADADQPTTVKTQPQPSLLATVATRKQKAFDAVGKAFEPKVTAAIAMFKKYPGSEMISPRYSDTAKARVEKPGLFTAPRIRVKHTVSGISRVKRVFERFHDS
ncbi:hypothetical protein E4U59_001042 [Claviceps monticola]|nr:hypothetical protein E4U59_001042 [Claviceps monticola]